MHKVQKQKLKRKQKKLAAIEQSKMKESADNISSAALAIGASSISGLAPAVTVSLENEAAINEILRLVMPGPAAAAQSSTFTSASENVTATASKTLADSDSGNKEYDEIMALFRSPDTSNSHDPNYQQNKNYFSKTVTMALKGEKAYQFNLGNCFESGLMVEINNKLALAWFQKSADQGYFFAQHALSLCLLDQAKMEYNPKKGFEYLLLAEKNNNKQKDQELWSKCYEGSAKFDPKQYFLHICDQIKLTLIACYEEGIGTEIDLKKAAEIIVSLCPEGMLVESCYKIGQYYCTDKNVYVQKDLRKAIAFFRKASLETQFVRAKIDLACCLMKLAENQPSIKEGLSILEEHSKTDSFAAVFLGKKYMEGIPNILAKDNNKALSLLEAASRAGHYLASQELANCYNTGKLGLKIDSEMANQYLLLAYENLKKMGKTNAIICYELAKIFFEGSVNFPKDIHKAIALFQEAGNLNHKEAQSMLGSLALSGVSHNEKTIVEKNILFAMNWYTLAANNGDIKAHYELGCFLKTKVQLKSKIEAYQHLLIAANAGYVDAKKKLIRCYLEGEGTEPDLKRAREILYSFENTKMLDDKLRFQLFICEMLENFEKKSFANISEVIDQLRKANCKQAMYYLIEIYEKGLGVPIDFHQATEFLQHRLLNARLQRKRGNFIEHGLGKFNRDMSLAFNCYRAAFEEGDLLAAYHLGFCHLLGKGTPINLEKASDLFKIVVSNGMLKANAGLDLCRLFGKITANENSKIDHEKLNRMALEGNKEIAEGLCHYYQKHNNLSMVLFYSKMVSPYLENEMKELVIKNLEGQNRKLEDQNRKIDSDNHSIASELQLAKTALKNQKDELQKKIAELIFEKNNILIEVQTLKLSRQSTINELAKEKSALESTKQNLKKTIDAERNLKKLTEEQKKRLAELQSKYEGLAECQATLVQTKKEFQTTLIQKTAHESEIIEINKRIKNMTQELETTKSQKINKVKELTATITTTQNQVTELRNELMAMQGKEKNLIAAIASAKEKEQIANQAAARSKTNEVAALAEKQSLKEKAANDLLDFQGLYHIGMNMLQKEKITNDMLTNTIARLESENHALQAREAAALAKAAFEEQAKMQALAAMQTMYDEQTKMVIFNKNMNDLMNQNRQNDHSYARVAAISNQNPMLFSQATPYSTQNAQCVASTSQIKQEQEAAASQSTTVQNRILQQNPVVRPIVNSAYAMAVPGQNFALYLYGLPYMIDHIDTAGHLHAKPMLVTPVHSRPNSGVNRRIKQKVTHNVQQSSGTTPLLK